MTHLSLIRQMSNRYLFINVKMEDFNKLNSQVGSSTGAKFTDFDTSAVSLDALIRKKTYFDKSLFIKSVFQDNPFLIITAPRRLGKTTALKMFKKFVEIDCDEKGRPTGKPIQDTSNYQIFNTKLFNGESLKIMNETEIIDSHFGKYPVIYLDFGCDSPIESYKDAVKRCKVALRQAYKQHSYLHEHPTPNLTVPEQKECEIWCDKKADIDKTDITDGLRDLCSYLYKHFGKKVIILCDEYDSIIMKALFSLEGNRNLAKEIEKMLPGQEKSQLMKQLLAAKWKDLRNVADFSNGILAAALKRGVQYVERAIIMGISHIAGVGISGLNNIRSYTFLKRVAYVDYFGLTDLEVRELCKRYEDVNKISFEDLKDNYNGYTDEYGKCHIYPMWSVLESIDQQNLENYFEETGTIERLHFVFQIPSIRVKMQQLVQMKSTTIEVKTKISPDELLALQQECMAPETTEKHAPDTFLSFLLEQGYLTYSGTKVESGDGLFHRVSVKVPNREAQKILLEKLKTFYKDICQFDSGLQNDCKHSFDQLFNNVDNDGFEAALKVVYKNLENFLQQTLSQETCLKVNEAALHTSVCSLFLNSQDTAYCTEFCTSSSSRLDLAICKGDCGAIFEFKYCSGRSRNTTSSDALQQIINKRYDSIFDEEKKMFDKPPSKIILIGLSINDDKKLSITCQIKGKEKMIHFGVSEPGRKRKASRRK